MRNAVTIARRNSGSASHLATRPGDSLSSAITGRVRGAAGLGRSSRERARPHRGAAGRQGRRAGGHGTALRGTAQRREPARGVRRDNRRVPGPFTSGRSRPSSPRVPRKPRGRPGPAGPCPPQRRPHRPPQPGLGQAAHAPCGRKARARRQRAENCVRAARAAGGRVPRGARWRRGGGRAPCCSSWRRGCSRRPSGPAASAS